MTQMNITERAMLVSLSISRWTARKLDKRVTREVAERHGAAESVGRYSKKLIGSDALAEIARIAGEAREYHYRMTLPWQDSCDRILPSAVYLDYTKEHRRLRAEFEKAVGEFLRDYSKLREEARVALNGLYRDDDYPSPKRLAAMFRYGVGVMPLPAAADFRVGLDSDEVERVREEIEARCNEAFEAATRDLWTRIAEVVGHLSERLKLYQVDATTGRVSNPFKDSTVENLRSLVDLLPRLNVTGSSELDAMTRRLRESLCAVEPATLRTDEATRVATAKTADDILAEMASYIGGE